MKLIVSVFAIVFFYTISYGQSSVEDQKINTPQKDSIDSQTDSTAAERDSIVKIWNLNSGKDTIRISEIIAIKLNTGQPISHFKTLFINGIKIAGLSPWKESEIEKTVFFKLDDNVQQTVADFLGKQSTDKNIVKVFFSVEDSYDYADPLYLEIRQKIIDIWVWILIMSLILAALIFLALKKNVLKDDNNFYYSLGRTQMFYWTVLFIICYLYITYRTGALPDIPGSVLVILGISIGTTAASKVIENNNKDAVKIDKNAKSEGLLVDILSDGTSINIHRFQNVVFNLVFGLIFIQKTISDGVIPSFDDNVLLLLGISSGTYAGLKITEATKEQAEPLPQVGTDPPDPKEPGNPEDDKDKQS